MPIYNDSMNRLPSNNARTVGNLIDVYLKREGIDRRYSRLILQELFDATSMSREQLNQAASELLTSQRVQSPFQQQPQPHQPEADNLNNLTNSNL
jgi:hypothetical protein